MQYQKLKALFFILAFSIAIPTASFADGIPEPGIILYGVVTDPSNGYRLTTGTLEITYRDPRGKSVTNIVQLQNLGNAFSYVTELHLESPVIGHSVTGLDVFELPPNAATPILLTGSSTFAGAPAATVLDPSESISWEQRGKLRRLDLIVTPPDSDGDGLPDYWELLNFGSLSRSGNLDKDGDGVSDREEYLAGTDPNDPESFFKLTGIQKLPDNVIIRWRGPTGRTFTLLYSTEPDSGYTPVITNISPGPVATDHSLSIQSTSEAMGFYRFRAD